MNQNIIRILKEIRNLLYPDRCPYCGEIINISEYACKRCLKGFPKTGIFKGIPGGVRCASPLHYDTKYRRAVLNFKFRRKRQYAEQFAYAMYMELKRSYPDMIFDYISYVPMHWFDYFKRSYNQCRLISRRLSKIIGIPYKRTLKKVRRTKHQHNLKYQERRTNLKGAFEIIDKEEVKNKSILFIDDIVTTGATLSECTKTLRKAKPQLICCLTLLSTGAVVNTP